MLYPDLFRKLKETQYNYPKITKIVCDPDIVLALYLDSLNMPINELNIVWDNVTLASVTRNFREVIHHVENTSKEKGVEFKVIVEKPNKDNTYFLESLKYCDIRVLDNIIENFQISDNMIYIVPLFNRHHKQLDQLLWSNSKYLVYEKQSLFRRLWKIARQYQVDRKRESNTFRY